MTGSFGVLNLCCMLHATVRYFTVPARPWISLDFRTFSVMVCTLRFDFEGWD
jgi:hypothetical protein